MSAAIEFLYKYSLTKREYDLIPVDQRACIGLLAFAVTEINILKKAYIFSEHDTTEDTDIDAAINSQKLVILRSWSAKIFELSNLLKFKGKYNRTKDPLLLELGQRAEQGFQELAGEFGERLAKKIRDEATSHYYLSPARKNLSFLNDKSNLNFMIHEMNGNAYFPIGEELMFFANLSRFRDEATSEVKPLEFLSKWMDWNLSASDYASTVFTEFMQKIVFDRFPEKSVVKRDYWIPKELVGRREERLVPIFFRKSEP